MTMKITVTIQAVIIMFTFKQNDIPLRVSGTYGYSNWLIILGFSPLISDFIFSYMQKNIFGAITILLNITHVRNISFCSSMFIKKVQYKNIEQGRYYQNIIPVCPTQHPL